MVEQLVALAESDPFAALIDAAIRVVNQYNSLPYEGMMDAVDNLERALLEITEAGYGR